MMPFKFSLSVLSILILAACHSTKKNTTVTATPIGTVPPASVIEPAPPSRPGSNFFVPGDKELIAIRERYKEVTMETLMAGQAIYTGVCTNCHGTKSIYRYKESDWAGIIENMAPAAKLTEKEKDEVYKYVLAIKATQP